ncbi:MAG: 3-phosphoshikimate 1-carboxyvinyltransferase, partial [Candidatus Margulisbacteria bacterium]|nr:3-phosphoshikimate 1-carboxyvinyltransferase [Candidatus Margulisiibacteriota bacterium]
MNKTVSRSEVKGAIKAPTSKSYLQRALAMALLAKGKSVILDPNYCDDVLAAINVIQDLGAEV